MFKIEPRQSIEARLLKRGKIQIAHRDPKGLQIRQLTKILYFNASFPIDREMSEFGQLIYLFAGLGNLVGVAGIQMDKMRQ